MVRFISLHIKPAMKGEVANVVSRRGYKAAYSSLFVTTPQSRLAPCQLPVRGAFNSLSLAFGSPAPSTGSLLVRFISLHIKPALKGEVANVVSRRGYKAAYSSLFITTPQSNLRFASSPSGEPLHSLSLAFGSPAPSTGSLLVRFISLHIKPALKGEVANVVSRRGYKAAYSSLFVTTPQSNLRFASSP